MSCLINKPAPNFTKQAIVKGEIKSVSMEQFKGKWVVLFFYPMDFTFVCPTELIAFDRALEEFRKKNCEVLACSCDSEFSHLAWNTLPRAQGGLGGLSLTILADPNSSLARAYGVYLEDAGVALRGLFIIDPRQQVRQVTVNDLPIGRSVEETMRLLDAFQFHEENGEVCPAGWHAKEKGLKTTQTELNKYLGTM